jgi:hypothetical protein
MSGLPDFRGPGHIPDRDHLPVQREFSNVPRTVQVRMENSDITETTFLRILRLWDAGYYFIAVLIGLFMILWGIFLNGWDWLLIGAGLAIALIFGWYTWQVLSR